MKYPSRTAVVSEKKVVFSSRAAQSISLRQLCTRIFCNMAASCFGKRPAILDVYRWKSPFRTPAEAFDEVLQ
jgi:hypothetical protein